MVSFIGPALMSPLFSSAPMLAFVYSITRLSSDHAQNSRIRGGRGEVGGG